MRREGRTPHEGNGSTTPVPENPTQWLGVHVEVERRDLDIRPERDAVASYFGIHPSHLAALGDGLIALMAYRVQGDRRHWAESASDLALRTNLQPTPPHLVV